MARQWGFDFDADRCVQCHACELACKSLRGIEFGVRWIMVVSIWGGQYPDVKNRTISLACLQCGDPVCEAVCPTGAIQKRAKDGIVVVDRDKCIGCHSCFLACPFGIPQYGADGKMQKCDLCVDRLEQGKDPACVAACPAEAIHIGTMEELTEKAAKKSAQRLAAASWQSTQISR